MAIYDFTTDALVIRELPSGEHDRLLTLLSPSLGRICAIAKGARSLKNRLLSPTRAYVYANYELHRKGDFVWVRDASVIEPFTALQRDIEKLYLAQYIADVCCELSGEDVPAGDILKLALNSYYAICRDLRDNDIIKATFELRAASDAGYMPDLGVCSRCSASEPGDCFIDIMNGSLRCSDCISQSGMSRETTEDGYIPDAEEALTGTRTILIRLTPAVLETMRYVISCPPGRLLAFGLKGEEQMKLLSHVCETYLLNHIERGFPSLKLYHELRKAQNVPTAKNSNNT